MPSFETPFSGNLGFDVEFTRDNITVLPSLLTLVNAGTATYREQSNYGVISMPATASTNARPVVQSLSGAPAAWNYYAALRVGGISAAAFRYGLCLREAATGKLVVFSLDSASLADISPMASPTTAPGSSLGSITLMQGALYKYWRIRKNSGTSVDFWVSQFGGLNDEPWILVAGGLNLTSHFTTAFDQIGFFANITNNFRSAVGAQFLRLRAA